MCFDSSLKIVKYLTAQNPEVDKNMKLLKLRSFELSTDLIR